MPVPGPETRRKAGDEERGRIRHVTLRDVRAVANTHNSLSLIGGFDSGHQVEDILFENVRIGQQPVRTAEDLHLFTNAHVHNVRFS